MVFVPEFNKDESWTIKLIKRLIIFSMNYYNITKYHWTNEFGSFNIL